ncbi:MAG: hypothetical protein SCH66_07950 [Methanolobus sp.]|nr:hypothetical protein [Methanolobus sp.]
MCLPECPNHAYPPVKGYCLVPNDAILKQVRENLPQYHNDDQSY